MTGQIKLPSQRAQAENTNHLAFKQRSKSIPYQSTDMSPEKSAVATPAQHSTLENSSLNEPAPSFIKLAMRNMVKKGGTSLYHFFLSFIGLLGLFVGLAYLTR